MHALKPSCRFFSCEQVADVNGWAWRGLGLLREVTAMPGGGAQVD
jgi:hypothetical protein